MLTITVILRDKLFDPYRMRCGHDENTVQCEEVVAYQSRRSYEIRNNLLTLLYFTLLKLHNEIM